MCTSACSVHLKGALLTFWARHHAPVSAPRVPWASPFTCICVQQMYSALTTSVDVLIRAISAQLGSVEQLAHMWASRPTWSHRQGCAPLLRNPHPPGRNIDCNIKREHFRARTMCHTGAVTCKTGQFYLPPRLTGAATGDGCWLGSGPMATGIAVGPCLEAYVSSYHIPAVAAHVLQDIHHGWGCITGTRGPCLEPHAEPSRTGRGDSHCVGWRGGPDAGATNNGHAVSIPH